MSRPNLGHVKLLLSAALLTTSCLTVGPSWAQIPIDNAPVSKGVRIIDTDADSLGKDSGATGPAGGANSQASPGGSATGPSAPAPDLLSKYEKSSGGKPRWLTKLTGLLGAGGAPPKQAAKAYEKGDYDAALQKYAEAQLDHPESQALAYDIGNAQYRKKRYDDAIVSYKKALQGGDAGLAASAYYNLGNSHFRKGEFAIQGGKQEGIEDYREAMANYKKSLELRPDNKDAKRNIEVVQARIKELLDRQKQDQKQQGNPQKPPEPSEEAKKVLARALQLVQERRYSEAKTILEDVIQKDRTAVSFQSYVQRIDDVLKILRGESPTPPKAQDPRAAQPGVGVI
ncbi:MAG: tetratricopeptide repeat protein [Fibrobacteres bacterium]|jgi:tetratricopeptide (TPR) repeat protein|nr:tetratricopeptide repeat protein [Fibrobacterota bacterium]